MIDRRDLLTLIGGTAGSAVLATSASGRMLKTAMLGSGALRSGTGPHRRGGSVINGNLVAQIDPATPLAPEMAAQVRSAGLTAFKLTLGGSGKQGMSETDAQIADIRSGIAINPSVFMQIRTAGDFAVARRTNRTGIIFSFEAAEMLEGRVENIDRFRQAGVLVMGLSYNVATPFASGVLAPVSTGLTNLGREAVRRMNDRGVTLDLSHSDEASSMAAVSVSAAPPLITHAGCSAVHPHPRNKSDALLRALAAKGGVVGIYELSFLVAAPRQPVLEDYLAHLVHALNVCGEDHVGIGTDGSMTPFDTSAERMAVWNQLVEQRKRAGVGAPGEGPPPFVVGLNRPDRTLIIGDALLKRGYKSRIVDKVLGRNFERVFRETWTAS